MTDTTLRHHIKEELNGSAKMSSTLMSKAYVCLHITKI